MAFHQQKVPIGVAGFLIGFITIALLLPKQPTLIILLAWLGGGVAGAWVALMVTRLESFARHSDIRDKAPKILIWLFPSRTVEGLVVRYTIDLTLHQGGAIVLIVLFFIVPRITYWFIFGILVALELVASFQMLDDIQSAKSKTVRKSGRTVEIFCRFDRM